MSRRFQFSLRALLVGVLVLAAFLGGMAAQRAFDVWHYEHSGRWFEVREK